MSFLLPESRNMQTRKGEEMKKLTLNSFSAFTYTICLAAAVGGASLTSKAIAQETKLPDPDGMSATIALNRTRSILFDESFRYSIGDKLKITFFEQLQSGPKLLSALIERPELTGEYVVQQDGHVFLPLLGPIEVFGQTTQSLEQA